MKTFLILLFAALVQTNQVLAACEDDWEKDFALYKAARLLWKDNGCYQYTLRKLGATGRELIDPVRVTVVNGLVVSPVDVNRKPRMGAVNMEQLFLKIRTDCFSYCPDKGPTSCEVAYDKTEGYVKTVNIDPDASVADSAPTNYQILGFTRCGQD